MKKKLIFVFIALAILVSFYFDSEIVKGVSLIRTNLLNQFFMGLTLISSKEIIFFFLTVLFFWKKNNRKWILPLWISFGLTAIIGFLLKVAIHRQRPFQSGIVSVLPALEKVSHTIWNFSFPSHHAMFAFCVLPLLVKAFPKLKYYWISFAILIGFSRIYFGLHFLSDVIAGGAIGYLIGIGIIKLEEKYKFGDKIYKKIIGNKN